MSNFEIVLKDGSIREVASGTTAFEFAGQLSRSLQKSALVASWNGSHLDLMAPIPGSGKIEFFGFDSEEGKEALRHTSSHILAQAVSRLFPEA